MAGKISDTIWFHFAQWQKVEMSGSYTEVVWVVGAAAEQ